MADDSAVPAFERLPAPRRDILVRLKQQGEETAAELAGALGVTAGAVRQQLSGMTEEGLVRHRVARGGPGRPTHVYAVAAAAEDLFPRAYDGLARDVLDTVAAEDPAMVERIFERRRARRVRHAAARMEGKDFADRVAELARILDEDGYLADFEALPDGTYRITEHNCAIFAVAMHYGGLCTSEIEFIREVLPEAEVERIAHMLGGAHSCAYRVQPHRAA